MKTLNQKRLAKVIALGLVVGSFSFANVDNVYAANIGNGQKVVTDVHDGYGPITGKHYVTADKNFTAASQKDLVAVNKEAEQAKKDAAAAKEKADLAYGKADKADKAAETAQTVANAANDQATINKSDIADLKQDMAGKADQSDVNNLNDRVANAEDDIKTNKGNIAENKKNLIQVNKDNLKQDNAIKQLENHDALHEKEIKDLQDNKADKSDINDLKVEDAKQNTAIHDLQFANGQQDMAIEDAQNAADKANDRLDTLKPQVDKNTSDIAKLENNKLGKEEFNSYTDKQGALDKEQSDKITELDQTKADQTYVDQVDKELHSHINEQIERDKIQDDEISQTWVTANNAQLNANKANGRLDALEPQVEENKGNIEHLQSQVGNATEKANHNYIKAEESLSKNVSDLDGALKTEETERVKEDVRLDGRIDTVDQKFSGEVSRLDSRIDKVDDKINKVGAMAAAIANLHTMGYDPEAPTEFAMSMGQYRDETGMAIGLFHYPNRDFMLSLSVSRAGEEYMGGIGATWKFGRKSPEKMLAEQKEKAAKEKLAKAEAMKEAARQARVEAQMARHAKMLAEREAAK